MRQKQGTRSSRRQRAQDRREEAPRRDEPQSYRPAYAQPPSPPRQKDGARRQDRRDQPRRDGGYSSFHNDDRSYRPRSPRGVSYPRLPSPGRQYPHRPAYASNESGRDGPRPGAYAQPGYQPSAHYQSIPPPPSHLPPPPPPPQGDFAFRMPPPPGVMTNLRKQPPREFREGNGDSGYTSNRHRAHQPNANRGRGGRNGRFFARQSFRASDRDLILNKAAEAEFIIKDPNSATFRIADEPEAIGDSSADGEPPVKRAKHDADAAQPVASVPKWSNPDPYTAAPPTLNPERKKLDVVEMIRKSRVDAVKKRETEAGADFISFSSDSDDDDNNSVEIAVDGPITDGDPRDETRTSAAEEMAPVVGTKRERKERKREKKSRKRDRELDRERDEPVRPQRSQRRTADDDLVPPKHARLKFTNRLPPQGTLLREWQALEYGTPCPWAGPLSLDDAHKQGLGPMQLLHTEIMDFYNHFRPRGFEVRVRDHLLQELDRELTPKLRIPARLQAFGSYMSGLYLPTADMDIVCCSAQYLDRGQPAITSKSTLWRFKDAVCTKSMALHDHVEVISKARVPLVKFVHATTGLKVDISFENKSGLEAINTFRRWRDEFPAMAPLVMLLKQFLAMRGLNEPVNGGIGGFTVICLVVSMLQLMPDDEKEGSEARLGHLLMRFFDFYGNTFDYCRCAIRMDPPGIIRKTDAPFVYKATERLSVLDPHNASNDIAGGSSNWGAIMKSFSVAHTQLTRELQKPRAPAGSGGSWSLLEPLLGGNYTSFVEQRAHLRKFHERVLGPCDGT